MKNLAQYIENLIIKHECVIVPGLGGFLTYRDSARILNNQLYAPTKRIRFNSLLTHHDGLLAEAYMQDRHISYSDALNAIKQDVEQIKSSLESGNTVLLGRIGSLTLHNGTITLNDNTKLLPENIGLPVVHLKQLSKTTTTGNTITINIPQTSTNALRYVASIAIIFLITLFIPTTVTDTTHQATIYRTQSTDYRVQAIDSISNSIETIDTIAAIETKLTDINSKFSTQDSNKYHLIIASLTSQAEAEEYIANHKHFDKSELQIIESNGKYRISAAGFNKYQEALDYMDSIRTNVTSAPKAWILCQ